MTGLVVLDVVIGLIFIYLFYSLFCTVIVEILATNLGLRARNLKVAIVRLLSDGKIEWWETLKTFWKSNHFPKEQRKTTPTNGQPSERESLAESFYSSPIIKYLGFGSWFSKPAWIGNETFIDGVLSVIDKEKPNKSSLALRVKDFFENPPEIIKDTETYKQLKFYFEKSNGDLDRFKENLSLWYDEIGDRATGWYKKRIQVILFGVGLAVATGFNVDTIQIAAKLSQDEDARRYFIEASERFIKENETDSILKEKAIANHEKALDSMFNQSFEIQSILSLDRCKEKSKVDSLKAEKSQKKCCESNPKTASPVESNFDSNTKSISDSLKRSDNRTKKKCRTIEAKECGGWEKYIWSDFLNFIGCLITAFAISLGSPFWFDLLNKFMQLRGSVASGATTEKKKLTNKTENGEPIKG